MRREGNQRYAAEVPEHSRSGSELLRRWVHRGVKEELGAWVGDLWRAKSGVKKIRSMKKQEGAKISSI